MRSRNVCLRRWCPYLSRRGIKALPVEWVPQVCCIGCERCPENAECRPDRSLPRDRREPFKEFGSFFQVINRGGIA